MTRAEQVNKVREPIAVFGSIRLQSATMLQCSSVSRRSLPTG